QRHREEQHIERDMREARQGALVGLERPRQQGCWVPEPPGESQQRQSEYGYADGFVAREERELLHPDRQLVGHLGERHLHDEQQDDQPVQRLRDCAPALRGVPYAHEAKLMRVNATCKLRALGAALPALLLCGCPLPPRAPAPAGVGVPTPAEEPAPHEGTPYDIVAGESPLLVTVAR